MEKVIRCDWPGLNTSDLYQKYHDDEWGIPSYDDHHLFEMLVLESFQSGLSWLTILNKRDSFRKAFDQFDVMLVSNYKEEKIEALMNDKAIVRSRGKIKAAILIRFLIIFGLLPIIKQYMITRSKLKVSCPI